MTLKRCWLDLIPVCLTVLAAKSVDYKTVPQHLQSDRQLSSIIILILFGKFYPLDGKKFISRNKIRQCYFIPQEDSKRTLQLQLSETRNFFVIVLSSFFRCSIKGFCTKPRITLEMTDFTRREENQRYVYFLSLK